MKGGPWFWARLSIQELHSSGSLPGFTATILVSLSGAARAFVIRLWHKFILLSIRFCDSAKVLLHSACHRPGLCGETILTACAPLEATNACLCPSAGRRF